MAEQPYLTEREEARERLKASLDALAERANLQVQMQKEPVKMLGGASAVGAVIGLVIGRQFRRSKKIYVDAQSPAKHQKALINAQKSGKGGGSGVGGALLATLGTLAVKTLTDRVLAPKLEELANGLLEKAGEEPQARAAQSQSVQSQSVQSRSGAQPRSVQPKPTEQSATSAGPSLSKPRESAATSPRVMAPAASSSSGAVATSPSMTAKFLKTAPAAAAPAESLTAPTAQAESYNDQAPAVGSAPPMAASHEHPGVVPTPRSVVEAKAQGSAIAPDEKSNPNQH